MTSFRRTSLALLLGLVTASTASAVMAEGAPQADFKRIRGAAIERLLAGKEFGDGVHWRYSFQPNGSAVEYAMSQRQKLAWRAQGDVLCWGSAGGDECFEVWTSSTVLRLQPVGLGVPLEGTLSRLVP
jgi:hypothetical protein